VVTAACFSTVTRREREREREKDREKEREKEAERDKTGQDIGTAGCGYY